MFLLCLSRGNYMQSEIDFFLLFINDLKNSALDKKSVVSGQWSAVREQGTGNRGLFCLVRPLGGAVLLYKSAILDEKQGEGMRKGPQKRVLLMW